MSGVNAVVDVSHHQSNVNFKLVKENGIVGVIHKATQGLRYADPNYADRRKAAEEERLLWGAYHFGVGANGKDQANHFLANVGSPYGILLALDIEDNRNGENITPQQAEDFVNRIKEVTFRWPVIYGSANFLKDFATPTLTQCKLWVARYGPEPSLPPGWNNWVLWQYTDGRVGPQPHDVPGIGACDRDRFNGSMQQLVNFWNGVP